MTGDNFVACLFWASPVLGGAVADVLLPFVVF